jgi:hypothetical protein
MQQAQQAYEQMRSELYQALSTSLWTYYLFLQTEAFAWEQPVVSIHSAITGAQLFQAAACVEQQAALFSEVAAYIHQYAGVPACLLTQDT